MGWADILGPAAGVISAMIALIIRLRPKPLARSIRSKLREELEILKLLPGTDHHHYQIVRSYVDALIEEAYKQPLKVEEIERTGLAKLKPRKWTLFILGSIVLMGFAIWTWQIWREPFNWWAVGTIIGAMTGLGWILNSYEKAVTYTVRAYRYLEKGEYRLAISECNKVIDSAPNFAGAYNARALAFKEQGEKAKAITDFKKYIALIDDPQSIKAAKQQIKELST